MINSITGACAIAGCWKKDQGFGLVVVGETPAATNAARLVTLVSTLVKTAPRNLITVQDGVASLPAETPTNPLFPQQWSWTAKDNWFKLASAPALISGVGLAHAKLPQQALGADGAFMADLGFFGALLDKLEADYGKLEVIDGLRSLGLDQLKIIGYARIANDGSSLHGVLEMQSANGPAMARASAVALIAAVVYPVFAKAREKARQTQSLSNLRQMAMATMMYAQDNDESLPVINTTADIKATLNLSDAVCTQPASQLPYLFNTSISGKSLGDIPPHDAPDLVLFYEQTPTADGMRGVAFLDGHVALLSPELWAQAKAKSGIK